MTTGARQKRDELDFAVIGEPLRTLLLATGNKIEREWPAHLRQISGAREFFLLTVRTTEITYRSVLWLAADKPKDPDRKPEFALSIPPLARTILDHLINVVFVLEDMLQGREIQRCANWPSVIGHYQPSFQQHAPTIFASAFE